MVDKDIFKFFKELKLWRFYKKYENKICTINYKYLYLLMVVLEKNFFKWNSRKEMDFIIYE